VNGAAHGREKAAPKLLTKVGNSGIIYIERKKRVTSRRQGKVVKTPSIDEAADKFSTSERLLFAVVTSNRLSDLKELSSFPRLPLSAVK